jgi:uncharacterized protein
MWNDLVVGALGAVVLIDSRRLDDSFPAIDYFEQLRVPFVAAVNRFDDRLSHNLGDVREALAIDTATPLISVDARSRHDVRDTLLVVLELALAKAKAGL